MVSEQFKFLPRILTPAARAAIESKSGPLYDAIVAVAMKSNPELADRNLARAAVDHLLEEDPSRPEQRQIQFMPDNVRESEDADWTPIFGGLESVMQYQLDRLAAVKGHQAANRRSQSNKQGCLILLLASLLIAYLSLTGIAS